MNELNDKPVMLITGTSKGIGKYLADYYSTKGFTVIGCSRSESDLINENYIHIIADISNEDEILNIFKVIRKDFKRLDVLINNAAMMPISNIAFLSYETIKKIFKTNVFAPIISCREAVKIMSRKKFGRIVNVGSVATRYEYEGTALYTATKASIVSLSRVLSKEVINLGITVNVVAPSLIDTDLLKSVNQDTIMKMLNKSTIKKFAELTDVSNTIDYLIKEESSAITGQTIYLGGA
jgi:3-oxoacyl-[acyl-carrier protein] reductase